MRRGKREGKKVTVLQKGEMGIFVAVAGHYQLPFIITVFMKC